MIKQLKFRLKILRFVILKKDLKTLLEFAKYG